MKLIKDLLPIVSTSSPLKADTFLASIVCCYNKAAHRF
jgi:hypothetical protein